MPTRTPSIAHKAASAKALLHLAAGEIAAYEYACAHNEAWSDPALAPEQALAASLRGFKPAAKPPKMLSGEADAALKLARLYELQIHALAQQNESYT